MLQPRTAHPGSSIDLPRLFLHRLRSTPPPNPFSIAKQSPRRRSSYARASLPSSTPNSRGNSFLTSPLDRFLFRPRIPTISPSIPFTRRSINHSRQRTHSRPFYHHLFFVCFYLSSSIATTTTQKSNDPFPNKNSTPPPNASPFLQI